MAETDEYADEQPELVVRKVADPQDDSEAIGADADGQESGPQAQAGARNLMSQGQM